MGGMVDGRMAVDHQPAMVPGIRQEVMPDPDQIRFRLVFQRDAGAYTGMGEDQPFGLMQAGA